MDFATALQSYPDAQQGHLSPRSSINNESRHQVRRSSIKKRSKLHSTTRSHGQRSDRGSVMVDGHMLHKESQCLLSPPPIHEHEHEDKSSAITKSSSEGKWRKENVIVMTLEKYLIEDTNLSPEKIAEILRYTNDETLSNKEVVRAIRKCFDFKENPHDIYTCQGIAKFIYSSIDPTIRYSDGSSKSKKQEMTAAECQREVLRNMMSTKRSKKTQDKAADKHEERCNSPPSTISSGFSEKNRTEGTVRTRESLRFDFKTFVSILSEQQNSDEPVARYSDDAMPGHSNESMPEHPEETVPERSNEPMPKLSGKPEPEHSNKKSRSHASSFSTELSKKTFVSDRSSDASSKKTPKGNKTTDKKGDKKDTDTRKESFKKQVQNSEREDSVRTSIGAAKVASKTYKRSDNTFLNSLGKNRVNEQVSSEGKKDSTKSAGERKMSTPSTSRKSSLRKSAESDIPKEVIKGSDKNSSKTRSSESLYIVAAEGPEKQDESLPEAVTKGRDKNASKTRSSDSLHKMTSEGPEKQEKSSENKSGAAIPFESSAGKSDDPVRIDLEEASEPPMDEPFEMPTYSSHRILSENVSLGETTVSRESSSRSLVGRMLQAISSSNRELVQSHLERLAAMQSWSKTIGAEDIDQLGLIDDDHNIESQDFNLIRTSKYKFTLGDVIKRVLSGVRLIRAFVETAENDGSLVEELRGSISSEAFIGLFRSSSESEGSENEEEHRQELRRNQVEEDEEVQEEPVLRKIYNASRTTIYTVQANPERFYDEYGREIINQPDVGEPGEELFDEIGQEMVNIAFLDPDSEQKLKVTESKLEIFIKDIVPPSETGESMSTRIPDFDERSLITVASRALTRYPSDTSVKTVRSGVTSVASAKSISTPIQEQSASTLLHKKSSKKIPKQPVEPAAMRKDKVPPIEIPAVKVSSSLAVPVSSSLAVPVSERRITMVTDERSSLRQEDDTSVVAISYMELVRVDSHTESSKRTKKKRKKLARAAPTINAFLNINQPIPRSNSPRLRYLLPPIKPYSRTKSSRLAETPVYTPLYKSSAEEAKTYLAKHNIQEIFETLTNRLVLDRPQRPLDFLIDLVHQMAICNKIEKSIDRSIASNIVSLPRIPAYSWR